MKVLKWYIVFPIREKTLGLPKVPKHWFPFWNERTLLPTLTRILQYLNLSFDILSQIYFLCTLYPTYGKVTSYSRSWSTTLQTMLRLHCNSNCFLRHSLITPPSLWRCQVSDFVCFKIQLAFTVQVIHNISKYSLLVIHLHTYIPVSWRADGEECHQHV